MGRLAFLAALFSTAAAELSIETTALLQSMPVPNEDAVSLQGFNRSYGEIFAFPEGMMAAAERGRNNATRKTTSWADFIEDLLDLPHSDELSQMVLDIAHDFNHFYLRSMEKIQRILQKYKIGMLNLAAVKDWMQAQFSDMTKFAYAAHEHIMKVVNDLVDSKKKQDDAADDGDLWDWKDESDTAAMLAVDLTDIVKKIEAPMNDLLIVWGSMQAKLFDITRVQFCQQAVTSLQCLVNISTFVDVEVESLIVYINKAMHHVDVARRGVGNWFKGLHDKLGTECVMEAEMFFESVKSWVKYVNASIGGLISASYGCPTTYVPKLTPLNLPTTGI